VSLYSLPLSSNLRTMKTIIATQTVAIPEGVTVQLKGKKVKVIGPRGTLERDFSHINIQLEKVGKKRIKERTLSISANFQVLSAITVRRFLSGGASPSTMLSSAQFALTLRTSSPVLPRYLTTTTWSQMYVY